MFFTFLKTSPHLLELFRTMLQQLICCEAPEMFNVLEKKNLPSAGGVSKLQLNFHFWVKCSFKHVSIALWRRLHYYSHIYYLLKAINCPHCFTVTLFIFVHIMYINSIYISALALLLTDLSHCLFFTIIYCLLLYWNVLWLLWCTNFPICGTSKGISDSRFQSYYH